MRFNICNSADRFQVEKSTSKRGMSPICFFLSFFSEANKFDQLGLFEAAVLCIFRYRKSIGKQ